jgi:hypothetical protein
VSETSACFLMNLLRSCRGLWVACLVVLVWAGCAAPTADQIANTPPTVPVSIDSSIPNAKVTVNGYDAGFTPTDVSVEVDYSGTASGRAKSALGSSQRAGIKSHPAGQVPPRKLYFDGTNVRDEGQSTTLNKPGTPPTGTRR